MNEVFLYSEYVSHRCEQSETAMMSLYKACHKVEYRINNHK